MSKKKSFGILGIYYEIEDPLLEIETDTSPDVLEAEMEEKIRPDVGALYAKCMKNRKDLEDYVCESFVRLINECKKLEREKGEEL